MPDFNKRQIARDKHLDEQALAGGGGADFTQLIDLIMQETGEPGGTNWADLGGGNGTVSQFDQGFVLSPAECCERRPQKNSRDVSKTSASRFAKLC